ncbi:kinase-like domain-containing protein [Thelephora terrestris]|uniref:Kinase-like domain-containing protein n=1 Tax=Thelephora terrestris TaxID=56493 RepID=A0A9P6HPG6_9AGAM|nr:kinase-like domain-containing protein [Thelephora terrestris]
MEPTSAQRTTAMTDDEMQRVISEIPLSRAHADPSACILALKPLLLAKEGRRLLMNQARDEALILIELFDWALKSHENTLNLNKGYVLWTLRQLCASQETLPRSCILPIEFKTSDPHHAAGGFADVWKGTYEGIDVAFKTLRRSTQVDDATRLKRKRRFCKEVILWKSLNHPNILGLVGVCRWDNTPEARLTMVSPWMSNGNITEYTKNNACQRMQLLIDCARGVQHIHRMGLVHGDLKGANTLITSDNPVRACLADFGFTTIVNDDPNDPGITSALGGGTVPFMAPELLCPSHFNKPRCQVSKESDVYAFGMVILQVLTSLIPFRKLQHTEISYKVIQGERPKMPEDAQTMGISQDLWDLLGRCWLADSTQRPRIEVVFQHLSNDPARGTIFPPWKIHPSPSEESLPESGTQKYVFYTADQHTPVEGMPLLVLDGECFDADVT